MSNTESTVFPGQTVPLLIEFTMMTPRNLVSVTSEILFP